MIISCSVTGNASRDISLQPNETFMLTSLNYPHPYPKAFCFDFLIRSLYGYQIHLNFVELYIQPSTTSLDNTFFLDETVMNGSYALQNVSYLSTWNRVTITFCSDQHINLEQHRYQVYKAQVSVVKGEDDFILNLLC